MVGPPGSQPQSYLRAERCLISIAIDTFVALTHLGNSKGFRSSLPKMGVKTKYVFLIINYNITEIETALPSPGYQSNKCDNICKLSLWQWHSQGENGPQIFACHKYIHFYLQTLADPIFPSCFFSAHSSLTHPWRLSLGSPLDNNFAGSQTFHFHESNEKQWKEWSVCPLIILRTYFILIYVHMGTV